jgi:putative ABC transport system substrate-binding protein
MDKSRGDRGIARRIFVGGMASAFAATPWTASAQSALRKAKVAFLSAGDRNSGAMQYQVDPLRHGLRELGYVEGQNLVLETHWADGQPERLPALLADLMQLRPDVLVASGTRPTMAAKAVAGSLPIVAVAVDDPVQMGLALSYTRPGLNITGVSAAFHGILAKRFQLLKSIAPSARKFAVLYHPETVKRADIAESIARHETTLRVPILMLEARNPAEIDAAFATMSKEQVDAVSILADTVYWFHRARLAELCQKQRLVSVWPHKGYLEAGGLVSYQGDFAAMFRRSAALVDKILKGTKASDIPFEQATKLDLVVNLRVAKALGLTIPQSVLLSADEVIE